MALKIVISRNDGSVVRRVYPSPRAFVEAIQSKLGLTVDGNWGTGTTNALLARTLPSATLLRQPITAAASRRSIDAPAVLAAYIIAFASDDLSNPAIGGGMPSSVQGFTPFTYGQVAPGASGPATLETGADAGGGGGTGTGSGSDGTGGGKPDGGGGTGGTGSGIENPLGGLYDRQPAVILGMPKPVAVGVGVGLAVLLGGMIAVAATRN